MVALAGLVALGLMCSLRALPIDSICVLWMSAHSAYGVLCSRRGLSCDSPCDRMTQVQFGRYSGGAVQYNYCAVWLGGPSNVHIANNLRQTLFLTRSGPTMVIGAGCVDPFGSYRNCSSRGENASVFERIFRYLFCSVETLLSCQVLYGTEF